MKKIRVGDEVKLRSDLIVGNTYGGISLLPDMKVWFNKHEPRWSLLGLKMTKIVVLSFILLKC